MAQLQIDNSNVGMRFVHLRGQGQVVPIFDREWFLYALAFSLGPINEQTRDLYLRHGL
jgi:hypothetical protein